MGTIIIHANPHTGEYFFSTDHCQESHSEVPYPENFIPCTFAIPHQVAPRPCLPTGMVETKADFLAIYHPTPAKEIFNPDPKFQPKEDTVSGQTITVIVNQCVRGTKPGEGRIFGRRFAEEVYTSLEEAQEMGKFLCGDGRCVIVRPNYNEKDEKGLFFREWRSFNGEALKEVRFPYVNQNQ